MSTTISGLGNVIKSKLGRCGLCMRWAFTGTVLGWLCFLGCTLIFPSWRYLVLLIPLAFTLLWLLHILVFAARTTANASSAPQVVPQFSRSRLLVFAAASGAAIFLSMALPELAFAGCSNCPALYMCVCGKCVPSAGAPICCGGQPCAAPYK